jgi:transcriptional regulator with XRE-family HTH domain
MDDKPTKTNEIKPTGRRYATVEDMARSEGLPHEVIEGIKTLSDETRFTRILAALRAKAGFTQEELGAKMTHPRTQSAISKLESGRDEELTLGDIRDYAKVLNERIGLVFGPPINHVEAIKGYATGMRTHMLELAKIASKDAEIEQGIQAFFGEAFFNILGILSTCQNHMPDKNRFEFVIQIGGQEKPVQFTHSSKGTPVLA